MANEILKIMNSERSSFYDETIPKSIIPQNALRKTECICHGKKIETLFYILNGKINFSVEGLDCDKYSVVVTLFKDRLMIYHEFDKNNFSINVPGIGCYFVKYAIHDISSDTYTYFFTSKISYTEFNYIHYLNPCLEGYENYVGGIDQFYNDNQKRCYKLNQQLVQMTELSAHGVSIVDYFRNRGINKISLFFADEAIGKAVLNYLLNSELTVKNVYSTARLYTFSTSDGKHKIRIQDINSDIFLDRQDHLLFCRHNGILSPEHSVFSKKGAKLYYLDTVLAELMTQTFGFPYEIKNTETKPMVIAVRSGYVLGALGFDRKSYTSDEKINSAINIEKARFNLINNTTQEMSNTFNQESPEKLVETLIKPVEIINKNGLPVFVDQQGQYLNIKDGRRVTTDTPEVYAGTIYLCGDIRVFGAGCSDSETISSNLQRMINLPYRVVNYSNFVSIYNWDRQLEILRKTKFGKNDIVVLILTNSGALYENQWGHWLHWDGFKFPVIKVDAFPMFYKKDRPEYFLLYDAYTPECNHDLAELIRDTIYQNISLLNY